MDLFILLPLSIIGLAFYHSAIKKDDFDNLPDTSASTTGTGDDHMDMFDDDFVNQMEQNWLEEIADPLGYFMKTANDVIPDPEEAADAAIDEAYYGSTFHPEFYDPERYDDPH